MEPTQISFFIQSALLLVNTFQNEILDFFWLLQTYAVKSYSQSESRYSRIRFQMES